jgi:hypothetical protein
MDVQSVAVDVLIILKVAAIPRKILVKFPHVCSLGGEMNDEFGKKIQFCGSMMQSLLSELAAENCTREKPYRATSDGITGFCCSAAPSSAAPQKCPDGSKSCVVLKDDQNPFEQSNSCGLERFADGATCPAGMRQTILRATEGEIESLTVPLCMSTVLPLSKTAPMCIPRNVLNELRRFGKYRNKDLRRWIGNCEIYDKVNIPKNRDAPTRRFNRLLIFLYSIRIFNSPTAGNMYILTKLILSCFSLRTL